MHVLERLCGIEPVPRRLRARDVTNRGGGLRRPTTERVRDERDELYAADAARGGAVVALRLRVTVCSRSRAADHARVGEIIAHEITYTYVSK